MIDFVTIKKIHKTDFSPMWNVDTLIVDYRNDERDDEIFCVVVDVF